MAKRDSDGLTPRQADFVRRYEGNVAATAKEMGISQSAIRRWWVDEPAVRRAVELRDKARFDKSIMVADELREWWSNLIRDCDTDIMARLKAADSLAKAHGMFVTRVEHSVDEDLGKRLADARKRLAAEGITRVIDVLPVPEDESDEDFTE